MREVPFYVASVLIWFLQGFAQITSDHYQYMVRVISFEVTEWINLDWFASLPQYHFVWEQMFGLAGGASGVAVLGLLLFAIQPTALFLALRLLGIPPSVVVVVTMLILVEGRIWPGQALFNYSQSLPHFLTMPLAMLALALYLRGALALTLLALSVVAILHFSSGLWLGFLLVVVGAPRWLRLFQRFPNLGRGSQLAVVLGSLMLLMSIARAASYGLRSPTTGSEPSDFNIIRNLRAPWHYNLETTTIEQWTTVVGTLALLLLTWLFGKSAAARKAAAWFALLISAVLISEYVLLPIGVTLLDAMWPERLLPLFGPLALGLMFRVATDERVPMVRLVPVVLACLALGLLLAGPSIRGVASSATLVVCALCFRFRGREAVVGSDRVNARTQRRLTPWVLTALSLLVGVWVIDLGRGRLERTSGALVFGPEQRSVLGMTVVGAALVFGAMTERRHQRFRSLEMLHQSARILGFSSLVLAGATLVVVPSNSDEGGRTVVETSLLDPYEMSLRDFADFILPAGERYLVPPDFVMFRAVARRAIVVDFKSVPIASSGYLEWSKRMTAVSGVDLDRSVPQFDALAEYTSGYCGRGLTELLEVSATYEAGVIVLASGCSAHAEASEMLENLGNWADYSFFLVPIRNSGS